MKKSALVAALWLTSCFLAACSALAASEPIIIHASEVKIFIGNIHFSERYAADAGILASKGYIAHWPDAVAAIFKAEDAQGIPQNLKIFAIPFADREGAIASSIIGGIIQSPDGAQMDEFITTVSMPISAIPAHIIPVIGKEHAMPSDDIAPLIRSINIGNRAEIWDHIIRNIAPKAIDSSSGIRDAFESIGYSCAIAPAWFPQKDIWYAATCIKKAP